MSGGTKNVAHPSPSGTSDRLETPYNAATTVPTEDAIAAQQMYTHSLIARLVEHCMIASWMLASGV